LRRDPAAAAADFVDTGHIRAEVLGKLTLREATLVQHFLKNVSRMDANRKVTGIIWHIDSMVIRNGYLMGIACDPKEADSILVIDPNRKLPFPLVLEFMKIQPSAGSQIIQRLSGGQKREPALGCCVQLRRQQSS